MVRKNTILDIYNQKYNTEYNLRSFGEMLAEKELKKVWMQHKTNETIEITSKDILEEDE